MLKSSLPIASGVEFDLFADFGGGTWAYRFDTDSYEKLIQPFWGYAGIVPASRKSPGFTSDGTRIVLFGGGDYLNELYWLDLATKTYALKIPLGQATSPPARGELTNQFVYDAHNQKFVLFGGRCYEPARCAYQSKVNDTWLYDASGNSWMEISSSVRPPARDQGQMYFDPVNKVIVLYGGATTTGQVLNDLWILDVATQQWTEVPTPAENPGGVYLGQIGYATTTQCAYLVYGNRVNAASSGSIWEVCLRPSTTAPTASFTATPASVQVGAAVAFNASASADADGTIASYSWNYGDGSAVGSGVSTSKVYGAAGSYTVTLTVTDNQGAVGSTTRVVTVTAVPGNASPTASFTATPTSVQVGTAVAFNASASADTDGTIASYSWSYGDGSAAGSGASTSKVYGAAGSYTVTLTVTDNQGAVGSTTRVVTVTGVPGAEVETVWSEDGTPAGAALQGNEPWSWVSSNPAPYSGALAHQSALMSGMHQHLFSGGATSFPVASGDRLFVYVYLDPANPPTQVMVQWNDGATWEHRAYWGAANQIGWGVTGTVSARLMGPLPALGQWVRLEVPASQVGLEGVTVRGVAFTLFGGRATWDRLGKVAP